MAEPASVREHLERLMPAGGRSRRVVGWGVICWTFIGLGLLALTMIAVLARIAEVFPFVVVAGLAVFLLNPLVGALVSRGVHRGVATVAVFAVAVVLVAVALALLVPVVVHQTQDLVRSSPALVRHGGGLVDRLSRSSSPVLHRLGTTVRAWVDAHAGTAGDEVDTALGAGLRLAHAGLVLLLGGFLGFLLLLSLPTTSRAAMAMVPPTVRGAVEPSLAEARRITGGYLRARMLVSAVVGILTGLGLWAVGMPYWLLLAIVVGIANLIPMLGSWLGAIPVILVSLATKPPEFLFVALGIVAVAHVVDGYVLSPIVLKETTRLHPVVVLLAVLAGAELFGFWGVLAAIPVAGVVQYVLVEWVLPALGGEPAPKVGRETAEPST
jgi:predicted PurR-regulated permease PerM